MSYTYEKHMTLSNTCVVFLRALCSSSERHVDVVFVPSPIPPEFDMKHDDFHFLREYRKTTRYGVCSTLSMCFKEGVTISPGFKRGSLVGSKQTKCVFLMFLHSAGGIVTKSNSNQNVIVKYKKECTLFISNQ